MVFLLVRVCAQYLCNAIGIGRVAEEDGWDDADLTTDDEDDDDDEWEGRLTLVFALT